MLETMATSGPRPGLVVAGALLFFGVACWRGPGAGLHVVDCGLHAVDLPTRGGEKAPRSNARMNNSRKERMSYEWKLTRRSGGIGAAIAVGIIGMKAAEAVGRNPEASTKMLVQSILAIAFAEAIVFYTLFLVK